MTTSLKTLAEIGTEYQVNDNYRILFPEEDHLIIRIAAEYRTAAWRFDHPHIASKRNMVLEYKHYSRSRGKFWTARPGVEYLFIVPKTEIYLNEEKSGGSYVYVEIDGHEVVLSVSGGTGGNGWTDIVHQGASSLVQKNQKLLKVIAEVATLNVHVSFAHRMPSEDEQNRFRELCAFHDTRKKIGGGCKIVLDKSYSVDGTQGPFMVTDRPARKRHFICLAGEYAYVKVMYKQIDWVETAKLNGVALV